MVNFCSIFFTQGIKIQNGGKMKHSFVRYIGCVHIASQKIRQIQAYHRKRIAISLYIVVTLHSKNIFVIQSCKQELLGWFFPNSYI